ncbi:Pr6Pr family membrane protein [Microcella alkalica]
MILRLRRTAGILSLVAGVSVLASIVWQVSDQVAVGRFEPTEYFAYFTIQTALIDIVVLIVGGILAFRTPIDPPLYGAIRASVFAYAVVTGVVYNLLLRGIPNDDGYVAPPWPNENLHVWIPIYIALDWLLNPTRPRLRWSTMGLAVSFPLIWVGVTMVHGALTGWYPYPFLEPFGPAGVPGVVLYVVGIAVLIIALAALAVAITRLHHRVARR